MMNQFNQLNQNPYMMQPRTTNGITWIQGVEGAKAYQLPANSNVLLMDSENDGIFYIKVSDNIGMCTLRVFKYEEISNTPSQVDTSQFVTRDELTQIIKEMKESVNNEQFVSTTKSKQSK